MQDGVGPGGQDRLRVTPDGPPDEGGRGGNGVSVAGGQVVEHDHLVPESARREATALPM
jgi:hypothetical protein